MNYDEVLGDAGVENRQVGQEAGGWCYFSLLILHFSRSFPLCVSSEAKPGPKWEQR